MDTVELTQSRVPQPGSTLSGKYLLKRLIGEGGMGVVFEAEHLRLRQPIAIKVLNPEMLDSAEIVERFEREARAAATLRSRHVVRVTDVEATQDGIPYMVMELLSGTDLESERERRKKLPYDEVIDYVLQACSALAEAHEAGIVHRDLKPANLFLANEEDRAIVKVLDFGISKFMQGEDAKLTSAGAILGTALYMSPEQIRGAAAVDARSDVWALGVILYELISGAPPWDGPTTRVAAAIVSEEVPDVRKNAALPEAVAQAIHAMLSKDAAHRPPTVRDVVALLAPYAPPGSVGAEVAEVLARRGATSQRKITAAQPAVAQTSPERSTMAATTAPPTPAAHRSWLAYFGAAALLAGGVAAIAFVLRSPAVAPSPPAMVKAEPPPSVSATPPAPPPAASVPPPEPEPSPAASGSVPKKLPGAAAPSPPRPSAARPKPPPAPTPPTAVNPPFLQ